MKTLFSFALIRRSLAKAICSSLVLLVVSSSLVAQVQPPEVEWEKSWTGNLAGSILELENCYLIANGVINKFEKDGNPVELINNTSASSILKDGGGFIILSSEQRLFYLKKIYIDINIVNMAWDRIFTSESALYMAKDIKKTSDDGYIITGWEQPSNSFGNSIFVIKTDSTGEKLWSKNYSKKKANFPSAIIETFDGKYIISGSARATTDDPGDLLLLKIDNLGNEIWSKIYGSTERDDGHSLIEAKSRELIVASTKDSNFALLKTDSFGEKIWWISYIYGDAYDIIPKENDGYIMTGHTFRADKRWDLYVLKTDIEGNEDWHLQHGTEKSEQSFSIIKTSENGYLIGGYINSPPYPTYLVKLKPESSPTPTQLQIYDPAKTQFVEMQPEIQAQLFNKDFGTIMMTHGWNGGEPSSGWMAETARVLYARKGETVNILAWDWSKEAGTIHLAQATMNVLPQSRLCAKELRKILSLDYNKPVHFMGHSLGAFLMADVCEMTLPLRPKIGDMVVPTHLTLWDPPDLVKNDLGNQILRLRKTGVYADLISGSADNKAYFVNAWIDVPVSERNLLNFYHDVYLWYQNHATLAENPLLFGEGCNQDPVDKNIGFNASVLFESNAKPMDFTCLLPNGPISTSYICHIDSCDRLNYRIFGLTCVDDKTPEKKITGAILSTGECSGSCDLPSDTKALLKKSAREGAGGDVAPDTTFTLTQTIDLQWDYISFTYEFSEIGNSQLTLSIESDGIETTVWLDNAVTDKGPSDTGLINIQEYRGKTVDLIFGFFAETDASTVAVSDVSYWQDPFHNNLLPTISIEGGDSLAILAQGESTAIALDASNSTDPNNDSLSFIWENKDGVIEVQPRVELNLAPNTYQYTVTVRDPFDGITQKIILREIEYEFSRGDVNQDGRTNITDPITILRWLFLGSTQEICKDAADFDDDGNINISDPIFILTFLFLGGEAPKEPFNRLGLDPTPDFLGCTIKAE